jgi:hypothetical protein
VLLVHAAALLGLHLLPFETLKQLFVRLRPSERFRSLDEASVLRTVTSALGYFPKSSCLTKALVLWAALVRAGLPCEVVAGVRLEAQKLDAHAWVEREGRVLLDREDVRSSYSRFARPLLGSHA